MAGPAGDPRAAAARRIRPAGAAFALLFLYAAVVAAGAAGVRAGLVAPPALALWHGHELLLGFAPGLMGAYLVGVRKPADLAPLGLAWLAGRAAVLAACLGAPALWLALTLAYPVALAADAAPPFLRRDTRWRNRLIAVPLLLLGIAETVFVLGAVVAPALEPAGLLLAAGAVIAMMLTMGGRLAAAAVNGARQKRGLPRAMGALDGRLETAMLAALALWLAGELAGVAPLARSAAMAAAAAVVLRMLAWRPLPALGLRRVRLFGLGLGWVATGLMWRAVHAGTGHAALVMLHPAFVGGLGVLAATASLQLRLQRIAPIAELGAPAEVVAALVSLAAGARMAALAGEGDGWLALSAAAWVLAAGIVAAHHLLLGRRPRGGAGRSAGAPAS